MSGGCGISKSERRNGEMQAGYVRLIEERARIELHGSEMNELGTDGGNHETGSEKSFISI